MGALENPVIGDENISRPIYGLFRKTALTDKLNVKNRVSVTIGQHFYLAQRSN